MSDTLKHFKNLLKENKLAHGYIFFGEYEAEVKDAAHAVVSLFEEREPFSDAMIFEADGTGSLGIDEVRLLKNFLSQKPAVSKKRIGVIHRAHELTHEAQNAMLKIAEEPPEDALIILTLQNPDNLLPTLRSRFHEIRIESEPEKVKSENVEAKKAGEYLKRFVGANAYERSKILKEMIDEEKEEEVDLVNPFLDGLILALRKDKVRNSALLREVLDRKAAINDYSVNRRLQLAYLSSLWYN